MKIFNKELLAEYDYRPLMDNHESHPDPFLITDSVSLNISPTAGLESQGGSPEISTIPITMAPQQEGCGGGCSCQKNHATLPDPAGIQAMLVELFTDSDPTLSQEEAHSITTDLELERLENIIHLSQQGNDWDGNMVREALRDQVGKLLNPELDRREAIKMIAATLLVGFGTLQFGCSPSGSAGDDTAGLKWDEYFKGNYRLMTDDEKAETVARLEKLHETNTGKHINISTDGPIDGVLYGYAFNISKCRGYMDCIRGCLEENNQDRATDMRYIRIHEHKQGQMNFDEATDDFYHEVPAPGHYYVGTQCFHCENPPCVPVCPVQATWKEDDGIVVVDYDWCIGCRYCIAACPYDARRFNWSSPVIPQEEINGNQHYLGNRLRKQGVTEKCTFCIQRTRKGQNPACVEACPTGARIFGNLLDPNSEIRWVLRNKKVFRLKEDLGTEPKFWYFTD